MLEFKIPTLEDKEQLEKFYEHVEERSCELTFANMVLWAPHYQVEFAIVNDMLVLRSKEKNTYSYPLGDGDIKKTLEILIEEEKQNGRSLMLHGITPARFERLEEMFPNQFEIEYDRDIADYVYASEKLATLAGKKLHGKRNHINRFKENCPDWTYEPITKDNIQDCIEMAQQWRVENGCDDDPEKKAEICVTFNYLKHFEELGVVGGALRTGGKIIAFTIGEAVTNDTLVVHIEKAYASIQGAYPMINQQFVQHCGTEYLYINREEDAGSEGLRKAKLSYRPEFLIEKGIAKLKEK